MKKQHLKLPNSQNRVYDSTKSRYIVMLSREYLRFETYL